MPMWRNMAAMFLTTAALLAVTLLGETTSDARVAIGCALLALGLGALLFRLIVRA
jgi:hypothetical protein